MGIKETNRKIRIFFRNLFRRNKDNNKYEKIENDNKSTDHFIRNSSGGLNDQVYDVPHSKVIEQSKIDFTNRQNINAYDIKKYSQESSANPELGDGHDVKLDLEETGQGQQDREAELRRLFPLSYDGNPENVNTEASTNTSKKKRKKKKRKRKERERQAAIEALQALPFPDEDFSAYGEVESQPFEPTFNWKNDKGLEVIRPDSSQDIILIDRTPVEQNVDFIAVHGHDGNINENIQDKVELVGDTEILSDIGLIKEENKFRSNPAGNDGLVQSIVVHSEVIVHYQNPVAPIKSLIDTDENDTTENQSIVSRSKSNLGDQTKIDQLELNQSSRSSGVTKTNDFPQANFDDTIQQLNDKINSLNQYAELDMEHSEDSNKKKKKKSKDKKKVKYIVDKENARIEKQTYTKIEDSPPTEIVKYKKDKTWKKSAKKAGKKTWKALKTGWKYVKAGMVQYSNGPAQTTNFSSVAKYENKYTDFRGKHQYNYR